MPATHRYLGWCCALVVAYGTFFATPAVGSTVIPAIVLKAAAANTEQSMGAIVHERHIAVRISAGPVHYSEDNDAMMLMLDGLYQRIRYLQVVENGRTLTSDKVAELEVQTNRDLARGADYFKQPFDQPFLRDYTYSIVSDEPSVPGEVDIAFKSIVRDDQHGDGVMTIASGTGRVLGLSYTPDVLPNHANSATTTETFGEPLPGRWLIVGIQTVYRGRVAFFGGNGTVTEALDHFAILPSAAAGLAALREASLDAVTK